MDGQNRERVYISMMIDALKKKEGLLQDILLMTGTQEKLLQEERLQVDEFNDILDKKGTAIEKLNEIDDGFDALFQFVKKEVVANRMNYKEEVQTMQAQIERITELGVKIQTMERLNSERFKKFMVKEKGVIKNYHVNNRTAAAYYQNMANVHQAEDSYFFNQKK